MYDEGIRRAISIVSDTPLAELCSIVAVAVINQTSISALYSAVLLRSSRNLLHVLAEISDSVYQLSVTVKDKSFLEFEGRYTALFYNRILPRSLPAVAVGIPWSDFDTNPGLSKDQEESIT